MTIKQQVSKLYCNFMSLLLLCLSIFTCHTRHTNYLLYFINQTEELTSDLDITLFTNIFRITTKIFIQKTLFTEAIKIKSLIGFTYLCQILQDCFAHRDTQTKVLLCQHVSDINLYLGGMRIYGNINFV